MLNRSVILGRVQQFFSDASCFTALIDAGNLGTVRFKSTQAPTFEVNDLVALLQTPQPTSSWIANTEFAAYELCTRAQFGINGVDEDHIFVVGVGMHLRPDPTFQVAATNSSVNTRVNGSMLVIPSYAGANLA